MSMNDFNTDVINEFRANDGKVGGGFEGANMILVHHTGARSGTERVTPLVYRPEGDGWVIFASKGGAPDNPDWYHNLKANPATTIEVGSEHVDVTATEVTGAERDRIWEAQKVEAPQFAEYEANTDRVIPLILLERR
ncbi:MAG: nitroreductase family deazaflavin-dependent oxidoreductase [Acidimicrobiales bacterium]